MSEKINGVNWNKSSANKKRRESVIKRLEAQLVSKVKPVKEVDYLVPLTEHDINRINKELDILRTRL